MSRKHASVAVGENKASVMSMREVPALDPTALLSGYRRWSQLSRKDERAGNPSIVHNQFQRALQELRAKVRNPEPILRNALRYIEACIDADRDKAERRAREDAGTGPGPIPQPVMAHHAVDGLHRQECPQCKRGVVA